MIRGLQKSLQIILGDNKLTKPVSLNAKEFLTHFVSGSLTTIPVKIYYNATSPVKVQIKGIGRIPPAKEFWLFKDTSKSIPVRQSELSIIIQTDKPIYKPGQTSKI